MSQNLFQNFYTDAVADMAANYITQSVDAFHWIAEAGAEKVAEIIDGITTERLDHAGFFIAADELAEMSREDAAEEFGVQTRAEALAA